MGSRGSLYGSAGRKIRTKSGTNDQREESFTQVWAAEKRKTLLLLLFIVDVLGSSTRSAREEEAATHAEWASSL